VSLWAQTRDVRIQLAEEQVNEARVKSRNCAGRDVALHGAAHRSEVPLRLGWGDCDALSPCSRDQLVGWCVSEVIPGAIVKRGSVRTQVHGLFGTNCLVLAQANIDFSEEIAAVRKMQLEEAPYAAGRVV
jgi:hypothetical protein